MRGSKRDDERAIREQRDGCRSMERKEIEEKMVKPSIG